MVELKKKVTLKTKVAETVSQSEHTTPQPKSPCIGMGKMLGVLFVLVVIAVVAFFLLKPDKFGSDVSVSFPDAPEIVVQDTDNTQKEEAEQSISESISNDESSQVVEEDKSNNDAVDNNENKPEIVLEQKEMAQATVGTRTQTEEVTSKTIQQEEVIHVASIEEKAKLVIRGDFGNGKERKEKLGSEYFVIQNKVNEMYREGLVR